MRINVHTLFRSFTFLWVLALPAIYVYYGLTPITFTAHVSQSASFAVDSLVQNRGILNDKRAELEELKSVLIHLKRQFENLQGEVPDDENKAVEKGVPFGEWTIISGGKFYTERGWKILKVKATRNEVFEWRIVEKDSLLESLPTKPFNVQAEFQACLKSDLGVWILYRNHTVPVASGSCMNQGVQIVNKTFEETGEEELPRNFHFFSDEKCERPLVAIASMTRHNTIASMEMWLDWHFSLGICHVFLRIQHAEWLRYLLAEPKYEGRISPIWVDDWPHGIKESDVEGKLKRKISTSKRDWQTTFVDKLIKVCMEYEIDWLVHIDDDELVYNWGKDSFPQILTEANDTFFDFHMRNMESTVRERPPGAPYPPHQVYDQVYTKPLILEDPSEHYITRFENDLFYKTGKVSYGNGKSAGRISPLLTTNGVHFFQTHGCSWGSGCTSISLDVDKYRAAILHYESPDFIEWARKFGQYRLSDRKHNVFGFYLKSVESIHKSKEFLANWTHADDKLLSEISYEGLHPNYIRVNISSKHDDLFYSKVPYSYNQYKGLEHIPFDMWDDVT